MTNAFPHCRGSRALSRALIHPCGPQENGWAREREGSRGGSSRGISLRGGSREPRLPRPSQDSLRMELILGCQAWEKTYILDQLRGTEAENEIGVSRASCMELRSSSTANLHPAFQPHHPQTPGGFHAYRDHCGHLKSNSEVERHCDKSKGFEIR